MYKFWLYFTRCPPKVHLRCLAFSDLDVGLLVQKAAAGSFLLVVLQHWHHCYLMENFLAFLQLIHVRDFSFDCQCNKCGKASWVVFGNQVSPSCDNKTSSLSSCSVVVGFHRNLLPIIYERICFSRLSRHNMFFMASCLHPLLHANLSHSQKSHSGSNNSTRPPQWDIAALLLVRYKITVSSALWVFAAMMISYLPYISIFNLILPVLLSVLH